MCSNKNKVGMAVKKKRGGGPPTEAGLGGVAKEKEERKGFQEPQESGKIGKKLSRQRGRGAGLGGKVSPINGGKKEDSKIGSGSC